MTSRSAWITVSGKIYIPDFELADALGLTGDDDRTAVEKLADVHPERIEVAFQDLANDKIRELFPSDGPVKVQEVEIDSLSR